MDNMDEAFGRLDRIDEDLEALFAKKTLCEEDTKALKAKVEEKLGIYLEIMESMKASLDLLVGDYSGPLS